MHPTAEGILREVSAASFQDLHVQESPAVPGKLIWWIQQFKKFQFLAPEFAEGSFNVSPKDSK